LSLRALAVFALLLVPLADAAEPQVSGQSHPPYSARADVRAFAAEIAASTSLSQRQVERWLAQAKFQPKIVAAMDRPLMVPPKWYEYSPRLLAPERVDGGVAFWRSNAAALTRAETKYGVPAEIIVAIIGVETVYGRNTGKFRVIDALATLAFDYPRRAPFFRGELREYLLLAHEQGWSPLVPTGSFAGAMGIPQFMPGSHRQYAVDFDGDGHIDLWHDTSDAIGSVANYLARHDWLSGEPVLMPARIDPEMRDAALRRLDGGISERRPLSAWSDDGVAPEPLPLGGVSDPVGLLLLEEPPENGEERASYWIAYPNFYVITRYNKSRLYAATVFALAQSIKDAYAAAR
jgi:membrane-bound lytic murein transglycosylase B